jgi:hypothetical protein
MEDRLQRLEAKVARLNHAAVWTHRLNRFTRIVAVLSVGASLIELTKLIAAGNTALSDAGQWGSLTEVVISAVIWVVVAWSAGRITDIFTTLVDVIGELSETV